MTGLDIKIVRIRSGVRQYELAAKIGICQSTLCEIEAEKKPLEPQLLGKILRILSKEEVLETVT